MTSSIVVGHNKIHIFVLFYKICNVTDMCVCKQRRNYMHFLCWCNLNPAYHILSTKQTTSLAFGLQSGAVSNSWPLSYFFVWRCGPTLATASSIMRFLDHTQRYTPQSVGTPLDELSSRRRDLWLYNTQHLQQTEIHVHWWDSNPQSQQASGRRPTPQTARPLGPAVSFVMLFI